MQLLPRLVERPLGLNYPVICTGGISQHVDIALCEKLILPSEVSVVMLSADIFLFSSCDAINAFILSLVPVLIYGFKLNFAWTRVVVSWTPRWNCPSLRGNSGSALPMAHLVLVIQMQMTLLLNHNHGFESSDGGVTLRNLHLCCWRAPRHQLPHHGISLIVGRRVWLVPTTNHLVGSHRL